MTSSERSKHIQEKIINPYKITVLLIFLSPFTNYVTNSGAISLGPLLLAFMYLLIYEIFNRNTLVRSPLLISASFIPFSLLSFYTYQHSPLDGEIFNYIGFNLIVIPFLVLIAIRVNETSTNGINSNVFLFRIFIFFVSAQLFICLGQLSNYIFGYGFPIVEIYRARNFIPGTFYNPNNLSAVILILAFITLGFRDSINKKSIYIFLALSLTVLLFGGSRSALILFFLVVLVNLKMNFKDIIKALFTALIFVFLIYIISILTDNSAINRMVKSLSSLATIFTEGISADNSMSGRSSSYIHFLQELPNIGLGTRKIFEYSQFKGQASFFEVDLLFSYPHSFIVEIGYWLGWPG